SSVSTWLLVGKVRTEYRIIFFVLELAVAGFVVVYLLRRRRNAPVQDDHPEPATMFAAEKTSNYRSSSSLPFIFMVFMVSYVAFLIFTAFFVDADTVLDL